MSAWGTQFNTKGKIRMLADPSAAFTRAVDLSLELPPLGSFTRFDLFLNQPLHDLNILGGVRSKRYSMVIENGVVKSLNVEPDGTGLSCSLADKIKV
jgi:peroxiredoxin 5